MDDQEKKKHDNFWLSEMIRNTLSVCNAEQQKATEMAMEMIGREAFCDKGERAEPVMVTFALQMNGQRYTMRVPLLSLVPLPFLQIDNANLSFLDQPTAGTEGLALAIQQAARGVCRLSVRPAQQHTCRDKGRSAATIARTRPTAADCRRKRHEHPTAPLCNAARHAQQHPIRTIIFLQ